MQLLVHTSRAPQQRSSNQKVYQKARPSSVYAWGCRYYICSDFVFLSIYPRIESTQRYQSDKKCADFFFIILTLLRRGSAPAHIPVSSHASACHNPCMRSQLWHQNLHTEILAANLPLHPYAAGVRFSMQWVCVLVQLHNFNCTITTAQLFQQLQLAFHQTDKCKSYFTAPPSRGHHSRGRWLSADATAK